MFFATLPKWLPPISTRSVRYIDSDRDRDMDMDIDMDIDMAMNMHIGIDLDIRAVCSTPYIYSSATFTVGVSKVKGG